MMKVSKSTRFQFIRDCFASGRDQILINREVHKIIISQRPIMLPKSETLGREVRFGVQVNNLPIGAVPCNARVQWPLPLRMGSWATLGDLPLLKHSTCAASAWAICVVTPLPRHHDYGLHLSLIHISE